MLGNDTNTTAASTNSDAVVTVVTGGKPAVTIGALILINESAVAGFFTVDGVTWLRLPASSTVTLPFRLWGGSGQTLKNGIQIKRIAGGTDLTGVWAYVL